MIRKTHEKKKIQIYEDAQPKMLCRRIQTDAEDVYVKTVERIAESGHEARVLVRRKGETVGQASVKKFVQSLRYHLFFLLTSRLIIRTSCCYDRTFVECWITLEFSG